MYNASHNKYYMFFSNKAMKCLFTPFGLAYLRKLGKTQGWCYWDTECLNIFGVMVD